MSKGHSLWLPIVTAATVVLVLAGPALGRPVQIMDADILDETRPSRDVAGTVWFQGFLADSGTGDPVDAVYTVVARIYDHESVGSMLWGPETHNGVTIAAGWFNIELGSIVAPLPAFNAPPYYLELTVDGEVMNPRLKLGSVPSAFQANAADLEDEDWILLADGGIARYDTLSIGTAYPQELVTIVPVWYGEDNLVHFRPYVIRDRLGEGAFVGMLGGLNYENMWIVNAEEDGWLWLGADDYPTVAVTDSTQLMATVWPMMGYPPGYLSVDGANIGYYGAAFYSNQNYNDPHVVHAMYYGEADNEDANPVAVYGDAVGYSIDTWGIGGEFIGSYKGVDALAVGTDPFILSGVYGDVDNSGGSSICYSIYGEDPTTDTGAAYAGYFNGDVYVAGTLTGGGPMLKIDNPLNPANEYLYHASVSSPDMMNVYNGNAVLDGAGEAVVELPDWFEALNRDFRYQLTCVGGFAPVYVAEEISGNRFRIAGGEPGMKVSWMVTGIRHDRFAEANAMAVVQEKPAYETGRYMHPEAYGLPRTESVAYFEEIEQAERARRAKNAERRAELAEQRTASERSGKREKGWWRSK